ncbi:MAG: adenylate/guanylate cyclase domain-containing protein [Coriobacteriia bacterium]
MKARTERKNSHYLGWLRAIVLGGVTLVALNAMPFYPPWAVYLVALSVGALAYSSPALAALLLVGTASLPVMAADFVVGVLFLIVGFSATQYLAADRAGGFIAIALAVAVLPFGGSWAIAVLAGYLFGSGPGAVAAVLACIFIEVTGILLGEPFLGIVHAGGSASQAVLTFAKAPDAPFAFGWLAKGIANARPAHVASVIASAKPVALLLVQPALWGAAAALGGIFRRPGDTPAARVRAIVGVAGSTLLLATLSIGAVEFLGGSVPATSLLTAGVASILLAAAVGAAGEWVFPLSIVLPPETKQSPAHGVRAEDADVDELLRLISSAEDELATRHTTHAVVMLTDMKSFSRMTEEVGSMASAKLVQRQRDLLLPVIDANSGRGKSTGGDGLVAAFDSPVSAVRAACEMQRAITSYCDSGRSSEELAIRIGIAQGEVVLDKGGRPFIGAALNLAARIMDLADGGRIMAAADVAGAAELAPAERYEHGAYELKNIQRAVDVVEVLWCEGLEPQSVRPRDL